MLGAVDHVVVGHGVNGQLRNRDIHQHVAIRRGRVARFIGDGGTDGVVAVHHAAQVRRRHGDAPAAVGLYGGGVIHAVQGHGDGLARFGVGHAVDVQILLRFKRVDDVVIADNLNGNRRRGSIHAVFAACRRAVAIDVSDAHLHAGVAIFQATQISRWYGGGPVAAGIHGGGVRLAAEGDVNRLVFFHVSGGAGQHQIRPFFCRIDHVIGGNGVNADSHGRQIHGHVMADSHRVTGAALAVNGHGNRARIQRADVCGRDRCRPGAVCQHRGRVGFTVDGDRQRRASAQPLAGTGDNQVLPVLDAVNHIVARHGVHTQARQVGINGDVTLAITGVAVAVGDAGRHGQVPVADGG
ncbi:Uncharacterised protein [Enterobacter cloacae]|nr:Uncharacterised protein [Enterobacter cloacae]